MTPLPNSPMSAVAMYIGHGAMPPVISANFSAAFDIMDVNSRTLTQLPPFVASCKSACRSCIQSLRSPGTRVGMGVDCIASMGKRQSLSDPGAFHNVSLELPCECVPLFLELFHHLLEALNLIPRFWRYAWSRHRVGYSCEGTEAFETNFALLDIGHKLLAGCIVHGQSLPGPLETGLRVADLLGERTLLGGTLGFDKAILSNLDFGTIDRPNRCQSSQCSLDPFGTFSGCLRCDLGWHTNPSNFVSVFLQFRIWNL